MVIVVTSGWKRLRRRGNDGERTRITGCASPNRWVRTVKIVYLLT